MLDEVDLLILGGAGGSGKVSFRRERYVPRGGPDGGDGGVGGDVMIVADEGLQVLDSVRRRRVIRAAAGRPGGPRKKRGRNGGDETLLVPVGTLVWLANGDERLVADLDCSGKALVAAKGGQGGKGNARFATATRKAPRIAEKGLPGEERRIRLELQVLAEVGLVGLPNAGKSSLLRAMSNARPKVGGYPFTTLEPYLGVVERGYEMFVVADIPGIVEGAHLGKGLGVSFLRHVERTRLLVQVVDGSGGDPVGDVHVVREEMEAFGHGLTEKKWLVAVNKIDLPEARVVAEAMTEADLAQGNAGYGVSAATGEGLEELLHAIADEVRVGRLASREQKTAEPQDVTVPAHEDAVTVTKKAEGYEVHGRGPERVVTMLGVDSEEARAEVMRRLRRMGVVRALRRAGAQAGDRVRIANEELEWQG